MKKIFCVILFSLSSSMVFGQKFHTNIALNKNVIADSEEETASAAVDGVMNSYWQSGSSIGDHWLEIDLGQLYNIDRVVTPKFTGVDSLVIEVLSDNGWKSVSANKPNISGGSSPDNPLFGFEPEQTSKIRLRSVGGEQIRIYEVMVYEYDPQPVFVNQSGYDINSYKRFTAPLASNQTPFQISIPGQSNPLYEGQIVNQIGDFTDFQPEENGPFIIQVHDEEKGGESVPFNIGPSWIERVSYKPAIEFMVDTRCWYGDSRKFNPTDESAGCPDLGVAWRDSHQMSFEIQSLLNFYFANPSAFSVERMPVQGKYLGLREELPDNTPEIVRLIYWAVDIYLRGEVNHTLLKEQLAYFVYAWPWLSEFIPKTVYEEALDYIFSIWGNEEINRWRWHDIEHSGNLFQTYDIIGTGKGQFPPGHSIVPNLMMYEVAEREGRNDKEKYFNAAFDQTEWLVENLDWQDPRTTKGQRQGEQVTITSLVYFLQNYPDKAPDGLQEKIESWANVVISRSENLWDFRRYSDEKWIIPSIRPETDPRFDPVTGFNEVGNVAGFPAPAIAASWIVINEKIKKRLKQLAIAQVDHVFGRNPAGRHFGFDSPLDFEDVEQGWFQEYQGGAGKLQRSRGVLDGSPKETLYPFDPYAGDPGHTEGWVTFNTPWNIALAYLSADKTAVKVYNNSFTEEINSFKPGLKIGIEITAPLNFNYEKEESAEAIIYTDEKKHLVELQEYGISSDKFRGIYRIPVNIRSKDIKISYGFGWQEKAKKLSFQ